MAIGQEIGNKLSIQSFGWNKPSILEAVMKDKTNDVFLMRVGGAATGLRAYQNKHKEKATDPDQLYGLTGQFKAIGADKTEAVGSTLYLPKYVHDMVEAALSMDDDVQSVRIGFDIYARYDDKSATSYVFVARDLLNEGSSTVDAVMEVVNALPMPNSKEAKQLT